MTILQLRSGDIFKVDEREFVVGEYEDKIFLTENTELAKQYDSFSDKEKFDVNYSFYNVHIRDYEGNALMTRNKLIMALESKYYYIG